MPHQLETLPICHPFERTIALQKFLVNLIWQLIDVFREFNLQIKNLSSQLVPNEFIIKALISLSPTEVP